MFRSNNDAGVPGQDSFGFQDNANGRHQGRGRARGDDFGLPDRETLVDLAATYLDIQARLWPDLVGTPAVPVSMPATIQPMAEAFIPTGSGFPRQAAARCRLLSAPLRIGDRSPRASPCVRDRRRLRADR